MSGEKSALNGIPDWKLARQGIHLLLNNRIVEAESLFSSRKDNVQMAAGYCFVTFMNALMTFEEEKLQESIQTLKAMERRCAQDMGWLKAMKNRVFGQVETLEDPATKLEEQIILADSQVCLALLIFLQQDLGSYVRGGWVLRKAWKIYQQTYVQLLEVYRKIMPPTPDLPYFPCEPLGHDWSCPNLDSPGSEWSAPSLVEENGSPQSQGPEEGCKSSSSSQPTHSRLPQSLSLNGLRNASGFLFSPFSSLFSSSPSSSSLQNSASSPAASRAPSPTCSISPEVAARLMSAVSFGYGVFQLCVSLLPPSLLRLTHLLGFEGDRQTGITALLFARRGQDMRAPLATLALLWYHTIVRPFFALDGSNSTVAGVEAARELILEWEDEFGGSALFLFFRGRVERLQGHAAAALQAYRAAVRASPQHEVQLLCLHEIGWCHLLQLSWPQAHAAFLALRTHSRWSKSFYAYLAAVCTGAAGNLSEAMRLGGEVPALAKRGSKGNQLENFILRRSQCLCSNSSLDTHYCLLLAFELLFLWHVLPSCSPEVLRSLQTNCEEMGESPLEALRHLVLGAVHCSLQQREEAMSSFRRCIALAPSMPEESGDTHVTAFALYELGVLLCKDPQTRDEGRSLLQDVRDKYKNYDFENRLSVRIHAALRNTG